MTIVRKLSGDPPAIKLPRGAIDTQLHLYSAGFPAVPGGPPLPSGIPGASEYRQVMAWLGIERCVVTVGNAHQFDNDGLLHCLKEMGPVAKGIACISGTTSDAEIKRLINHGICGVRIMDLPGGAIDLSGLAEVDAKAKSHDLTIAVQFDGSAILAHLQKLEAVTSNWILDHHGKFLGAPAERVHIDAIKRLIDRGNCWYKLAGCYESSRLGGPAFEDVAAFTREIVCYAPERVIWGTNWPHNLIQTTEDYPDDGALLDTVLGWVPPQYLEQVTVTTPAELFGFDH